MQHAAPPYPTAPHQPAMADVWGSMPALTGQLAPAVASMVAAHAPLEPIAAEPEPAPAGSFDHVAASSGRDSRTWVLLKHLIQLGFGASVLVFVALGDRAPAMALAYVATGLLLMVTMAVVDRERFALGSTPLTIVEVARPAGAAAPPAHELRPSYSMHLPLVAQMQATMPLRVDVT